jgi:formate hydrogenlyase subunit 3/multisubunit Na+/H+ antiporter MnhD subunit
MQNKKSSLAGAGAAILAALGTITCCGAPIIAGILATVGIGASQLEFLNRLQPYLIGIAILSILVGFYRLYFKKSSTCCGSESETKSNKKSKIFLWIVSAFILVMLAYTLKTKSENTTSTCCPAPMEQDQQEKIDCSSGCNKKN